MLRAKGSRSLAPVMLLLFIAAALAAGCGPQNTEVWMRIEEDTSRPCLGAAHMRLRINLGPDNKPMTFDEFGMYFDPNTFQCKVPSAISYPGLPMGQNLSVDVSLSDSSTQAEGILAEVSSRPFNVGEGAPIQEIVVELFRKPGVQQGTVIVYKPGDWEAVSGIEILQFRIVKEGDVNPTRAYYLAYDPYIRPDPFPLVISNLPAPDNMEIYRLYLEGLDGNGQLLRSWNAPVYLQKDTVFDVQL